MSHQILSGSGKIPKIVREACIEEVVKKMNLEQSIWEERMLCI